MIVGTFGALLCAVGLALVTSSVAGAAYGSDRITSYLFVLGVFVCDFGSMLNSFSFMGLIWHFPGKQTLVIALINATYQASALLPLILQGAMDSYSVPLYVYLSVWTLVVLGTVYVCYVMTPSQAEYYEQAKKVLGMPLPRPPADLKVREMLGKAWDVLRQDTAQHIASGMALAFGFALPGYYASMTAPYGEALFGTKADGERLAEINVLCTSVVGLAVGPFSGSIADRFGLEVLIVLFAMLTGLATVTLPLPSWPAQILCASSLTFFISLFTIFISRYLLLYSPPNRFGAVQGVYVLVVILISTPWSLGGVAATALLGTGVNAYRIPMLVFGLTGVVSLSWYAWYFQKNPPPENPTLLPEDEAELAKGFGCGNLEEVMEVTHMSSRKELIRKLASTDPDVIVSLMKSIDTEKMMELSRRSVDDIADMMETVEEEEEEEEEAAAVAGAPAGAAAADVPEAGETPIRARGKYLVRIVAEGDKEALRNYLLTEPVDDMWQTTLDMEEWRSAAEQKQMDKDFGKLIPGKDFAGILRQRPELKKFVQQVMKREMQRRVASFTGRKKK
ncbi:unnamed protein product [Effrenium voratum]|nr:unnamed protein product [Effrenium voratum]